MSCNQTDTSRQPISSNIGAMAAGYAIESMHARAAHDLCRRPLLRPARQEDGRRAAIRHFLNMHGQRLPARSVSGTSPNLVEQAGRACTAVASVGMRQAGMLVDRLAKLAMAIDAGLRFPAAAADVPSCPSGMDTDQACAADGASRRAGPQGAGSGGVFVSFSAGATQSDLAASPELQAGHGDRQADVPPDGPREASQTTFIKSALAAHVHDGNLFQVEALLTAGANVDEADADGNTALMVAARMGQAEIVRRLLDAGAGVNLANRAGLTALHMAALADNLEIAAMLLDKGPQLDQLEATGYTPLSLAVHHSYPKLVHALLAAGADPNIAVSGSSRLSGMKPLMTAVLHKDHEIAGMLLRAGARVNDVTCNGRNALLFAVRRNDPEMVELLSRADADPWSTPPGERSAFQEAVESGQHDMVASMLRHPKTQPCPTLLLRDGLQRAVYRGDLGMTSLLLEHGALADQEAQTGVLGMAIELGHDRIAELLRRHGARQPSQ